MEKVYFIVTCHGWSASNWLAHSINLNNNIVCSHSARNVLANDKEMHNNENLKKNIPNFHKGYLNRQSRPMDEAYDEIESFGDSNVYGSVHVYRLRDLPMVYEKFGIPNRRFQVLNMIRNPIDLVWSGYGQFKDLFRFDLNEMYWTLKKIIDHGKEFIHQLGLKYSINVGELDNLAFIGACAVLSSLKLDKDAETEVKKLENIKFYGHVKMEDVTTDRRIFADTLKILTKNAFFVENDYLDAVFNQGLINKHKKDDKRLTPKERFTCFNDWQKEVFGYFIHKLELKEYYSELGYDLTFLKNSF